MEITNNTAAGIYTNLFRGGSGYQSECDKTGRHIWKLADIKLLS